ncbi:toxic anion resistance protein [Olsenella sp. YH-ols2217]|uniref:Toxic anion resistance protein n=1 Tax=Kribbibacterium absianum TaxID=3044210 RepID=A0ABT6ZHZ2_9ACTN|nr:MULTISPECIES: toxic anion resistance protein [unclassified Olsenella]MDJ1121183.1 toxic anion resistance protein [Olsenella sp. YH-ols2216]MDJ1128674.1 toxic anion resistance protein [Olsenella sp. YH-ols2217]
MAEDNEITIDDLTDFEAAPSPSLTLSPSLGQEEETVTVTVAEKAQAPQLDDSLSVEERKQVDAFSKQIDISNSTQIMQYGAGAQKKMADFSQATLEKVRTQDLGEVGDMITGVVTELRNLDAEEEKGLFGFFKKRGNKLATIKTRYDKAEANIEKVVDALKDNQMQLMKDSATLDKLYDLNMTYFKELTMYILAGKQRVEEVKNGELKELRAKAATSGRTEDAEAVQKLESQIDRFEKKLSDLDLSRTISMQTAPQIRMVQNNEILMIEKIQTTLVNTIPLWKSQMVLALGIANAEAAVKAQRTVTDTTNELLRKNAELLKTSTTEVARESERGIVDLETLKATNESLIQTFDEVMQIQQEGRQKRAEAEKELREMERELKQKLLEVPRG